MTTKFDKSPLKPYAIILDVKSTSTYETFHLVHDKKDRQKEAIVNKWEGIPHNIVEKILLLAIESFIPGLAICYTHQSLIHTYKKFEVIKTENSQFRYKNSSDM